MLDKKVYEGVVIQSEDASFTASDGGHIEGWRIAIIFGDEKSYVGFFTADHQDYQHAKQVQKGEYVKITCYPVATNNGGIKWKPLWLESDKNGPPSTEPSSEEESPLE